MNLSHLINLNTDEYDDIYDRYIPEQSWRNLKDSAKRVFREPPSPESLPVIGIDKENVTLIKTILREFEEVSTIEY